MTTTLSCTLSLKIYYRSYLGRRMNSESVDFEIKAFSLSRVCKMAQEKATDLLLKNSDTRQIIESARRVVHWTDKPVVVDRLPPIERSVGWYDPGWEADQRRINELNHKREADAARRRHYTAVISLNDPYPDPGFLKFEADLYCKVTTREERRETRHREREREKDAEREAREFEKMMRKHGNSES